MCFRLPLAIVHTHYAHTLITLSILSLRTRPMTGAATVRRPPKCMHGQHGSAGLGLMRARGIGKRPSLVISGRPCPHAQGVHGCPQPLSALGQPVDDRDRRPGGQPPPAPTDLPPVQKPAWDRAPGQILERRTATARTVLAHAGRRTEDAP